MKKLRRQRWPAWLTVILLMAFAALPGMGSTSSATTAASPNALVKSNPPPFDFSDDYYRQNGIVPENIGERAGTPARNPLHWTFDNSNTNPNRRNVRILETTGGWNNSGNLIYPTQREGTDLITLRKGAAGLKVGEGFATINSINAALYPGYRQTGNPNLAEETRLTYLDKFEDWRIHYLANEYIKKDEAARAEAVPWHIHSDVEIAAAHNADPIYWNSEGVPKKRH